MIRSLAPDELTWFLSRYYQFIHHSDPRGLAKRVLAHARDLDHEAVNTFILIEDDSPKAGVNVLAPEYGDDDQNLFLSNVWYDRDPKDLFRLCQTLLTRFPHEAAHVPLYNFSQERVQALEGVFGPSDFKLEGAYDLAFSLSELPPLGLPLVLEAWTHRSEEGFREVYQVAEAKTISDSLWAYLKRYRSSFSPDLWFIARETLDQAPVGYVFFGAKRSGIDGIYYLTGAGVLQEHRFSSEMLRRLVLSAMHELASQSPLGRLETTISTHDPKLIQIFESLGFDTFNRYQLFVKRPS